MWWLLEKPVGVKREREKELESCKGLLPFFPYLDLGVSFSRLGDGNDVTGVGPTAVDESGHTKSRTSSQQIPESFIFLLL